MRYFSWVLTFPLFVFVVVFAISNRQPVSLSLFPLPFEITIPIFLIPFAAALIGFIVGGIVAWKVGHKNRHTMQTQKNHIASLEKEIKALSKRMEIGNTLLISESKFQQEGTND